MDVKVQHPMVLMHESNEVGAVVGDGALGAKTWENVDCRIDTTLFRAFGWRGRFLVA